MPVWIFAAYAVRLTETLTAPPLLPRSASSSASGTLGAVHVRCGAHEPQIAWQRGSWLVDDASGRTLAGYDVCAAVCPQLHGGGAFGGALCYVDGREYARPALAAAELPLDDDEAPAVEVRCGSADARPLSIAAAEALMPSARAALAGRPLERAARDYAVCQAACVRVPPTTNGSAHAEAWPRPARRRGDAPPFRYVELALSHHMGGAEAAVLVRLPAALAAQSLVGSPECFRSDADADADADAAPGSTSLRIGQRLRLVDGGSVLVQLLWSADDTLRLAHRLPRLSSRPPPRSRLSRRQFVVWGRVMHRPATATTTRCPYDPIDRSMGRTLWAGARCWVDGRLAVRPAVPRTAVPSTATVRVQCGEGALTFDAAAADLEGPHDHAACSRLCLARGEGVGIGRRRSGRGRRRGERPRRARPSPPSRDAPPAVGCGGPEMPPRRLDAGELKWAVDATGRRLWGYDLCRAVCHGQSGGGDEHRGVVAAVRQWSGDRCTVDGILFAAATPPLPLPPTPSQLWALAPPLRRVCFLDGVGYSHPNLVLRGSALSPLVVRTGGASLPSRRGEPGRTPASADLAAAFAMGRCPGGCSAHGRCTSGGTCACDRGYEGPMCASAACDCSGGGRCNALTGVCKCDLGHAGANCELSCGVRACSGHGACTETAHAAGGALARRGAPAAWCACEPGWGGNGGECSSRLECSGASGGCSGHGFCALGRCACEPGWRGTVCAEGGSGVCPRGRGKEGGSVLHGRKRQICSGGGECSNGRCYCDPGREGAACERISQCSNSCSGHGECRHGHCFCTPRFTGSDCSVAASCDGTGGHGDRSCSMRGICLHGSCLCQAGFAGEACETLPHQLLPGLLSGSKSLELSAGCPFAPHGDGSATSICGDGVCIFNKCICPPTRTGRACDVVVRACPDDCSGHGVCLGTRCHCLPGWTGHACATPERCPSGCSGNGVCFDGRCLCSPLFQGRTCAVAVATSCPHQCSGRGICALPEGTCLCEPGYAGRGCERVSYGAGKCPAMCSSGGGEGESKSVSVSTSERGSGVRALAIVAISAAQHGLCHAGRCFCRPGFSGADCAVVAPQPCPNECSAHGACRFGQCFCDPGWRDPACDTPALCPNDCSGRGECFLERCFCAPGWSGARCDIGSASSVARAVAAKRDAFCPNSCSMHGVCVHGSCLCQPGYSGAGCTIFTPSSVVTRDAEECRSVKLHRSDAPDAECRGQGLCVLGKCVCFPGFGGRSCEASISVPCPGAQGQCSGHGICFHGKCFCDLGFAAPGCAGASGCPYATATASAVSSFTLAIDVVVAPISAAGSVQPRDCSGHGTCFRGACHCVGGWRGGACEDRIAGYGCAAGCSGHGRCFRGTCLCQPGWSDAICSRARLPPHSVMMRHLAATTVKANVNEALRSTRFRGLRHPTLRTLGVALERCPECGARGMCVRSRKRDSPARRCQCEPGWSATSKGCVERTVCRSADCSGHGVCRLGRCFCTLGWLGKGCEAPSQPQIMPACVNGEVSAVRCSGEAHS